MKTMMHPKLATATLLLSLLAGSHGFSTVGSRAVLPTSKVAAAPAFSRAARAPATVLTSSTGDASSNDDDSLDSDDMLAFMTVKSMSEFQTGIAENWGFILQGGVVKVLAGIVALCVPLFANEVAYMTLTITTWVAGCFNVAGLFFEEEGFKVASLAVGLCQCFLAYRMYYKPFEGLVTLTALIAGTSVAEGLYEGLVALKNRDIPGWGGLLLSGAVSILGGIFVAKNLPATSLVVLGIMLGSHLISGGWASIGLALDGRDTANTAIAKTL